MTCTRHGCGRTGLSGTSHASMARK
jgi:hypothetical protein